jgi:Leucine-rich repeat (LRR) protein
MTIKPISSKVTDPEQQRFLQELENNLGSWVKEETREREILVRMDIVSQLIKFASFQTPYLCLIGYQISECPPPQIGCLTWIRIFHLRRCDFAYLPPEIGNLTALTTLRITECYNLIHLPSSIGNLTNLKNLDVSECGALAQVPSEIGNLMNLKTLDLLGCSALLQVPSSIGNLTALTTLRITHCYELARLPAEIGNLTNLKNLDVSGCIALAQVPSEIGDLRKLTSLNLSHCRALTQLPFAPAIEKLTLTGCNPLIHVPSPLEIKV